MLTKSKLTAWRQCPKRLWLETRSDSSPSATAKLSRGASVGKLAQKLLGDGHSQVLDRHGMPTEEARIRTADLLAARQTVFEGAFGDDALLVYADAVRPAEAGLDLIEVKDSGSVKSHHIEDAAIQLAAAQRSGAAIHRVIICHLDTTWVYPGGGDYRGIFVEADVTEAAAKVAGEVAEWIDRAAETMISEAAPERATGRHCSEPYSCQFHESCSAEEPVVDRPLSWLPGQLRRDAKSLRDGGAFSMDDLPDDTLSALQLRVKIQTIQNEEYFDRSAAAAELAGCAFPLHFLDFETVNPAVPVWAETRPYAQIPFQFSLHIVAADGTMQHRDFLFTSGSDPSRPFAEALVNALGTEGTVVVYNAAFERSRMRELAARFPDLSSSLEAAIVRIFDLQPVAKAHYYHPAQQGSWSIKKVLPCLAPELRYDDLEGVQDGSMAIEAYFEILDAACTPERKEALEAQLLEYCKLDTLAMVALYARFAGSEDLMRRVVRTRRNGGQELGAAF